MFKVNISQGPSKAAESSIVQSVVQGTKPLKSSKTTRGSGGLSILKPVLEGGWSKKSVIVELEDDDEMESDREASFSKSVKSKSMSKNRSKKGLTDDSLKTKRNLKGSEEVLKAKFANYMTKKKKPLPYWKCKCNKVFVDETDALQHINQPKCKMSSNRKQKSCQCYICEEVFASKKALEQHAKKEHLEPLTCRRCPAVEFKTKASLNRHIKSVHGDQSFACRRCEKVFNREDSKDRHEETVHRGQGEGQQEPPFENRKMEEEHEEEDEEVVHYYVANAKGIVVSFINEKFAIIRHDKSKKKALVGSMDLWLTSETRAFKQNLTSLLKVGDEVFFHAALLKPDIHLPYFATALWRSKDVEDNKYVSGQLIMEVRAAGRNISSLSAVDDHDKIHSVSARKLCHMIRMGGPHWGRT